MKTHQVPGSEADVVRCNDSIRQLAGIMRCRGVRSAPVSANGKLGGMVTHGDIVLRPAADTQLRTQAPEINSWGGNYCSASVQRLAGGTSGLALRCLRRIDRAAKPGGFVGLASTAGSDTRSALQALPAATATSH